MKKTIVIIFTLLLVSACATGPMVTGSNILLNKQKAMTQNISPDQVRLYLSTPLKSYHAVAIITASAQIGHYSDLSHVESALIEELRRQAAAAGANGIIQITKETLSGQTVITNTVWSNSLPHEELHQPSKPLIGLNIEKNAHKTISSEYSVIYRGKAILVDE